MRIGDVSCLKTLESIAVEAADQCEGDFWATLQRIRTEMDALPEKDRRLMLTTVEMVLDQGALHLDHDNMV